MDVDIPKVIGIPISEPIKMDETFIQKIKTPLTYGTFAVFFIIILCIILYLIYSGPTSATGNPKSLSQEEIQTIFIVLSITIVMFVCLFIFVPNYKNLLVFLGKFTMVFALLAYIIGIIVLYRTVPSGIINGYAFLFLPITIVVGIYLFYMAMKTGSPLGFDINVERIKYALLYFLLIVFLILFYTINPGGYITKYFGPLLVISILLIVFGFLYLITLMTLPSLNKSSSGVGLGSDSKSEGFFKGISTIGLISGVSFIIFLLVVLSGILYYPGGFIKNGQSDKVAITISLLVFVFIVWIVYFGILSFSKQTGGSDTASKITAISGIARQIFLLLFGLTFSGFLIWWLITGVEGLSSQSGTVSFILNLLLLTMVLGLVFKLISGGTYYKKSAFFRIIVNTILYIPCILVSFFDTGINLFGKVDLSKTIDATKNTPTSYYIVLFLVVLFYLFYYFLGPQIQTNFAKQGGTILVNKPVYTNAEHIIGSYDQLNGTNEDTNVYDYQYAISCWVFLDASSPNISSSLEKYTSILNFGNKPNILYNARENTLMITMSMNTTEDETEDVVVYKMPNVLLQKWNNIIINYSGGTVDIFYNGTLVKSMNKLLPKMSKDTLTIGTNNGVNGGICNVTYFNTSISASQIYYLYNSVKDKNPPVASSSKESIVKDVLAGVNINYKPPTPTIIPININITTEPSGVNISPDQPIKSDPKSRPYTDYLSFKWFATANNDNYNGL